MKNYEVLLTRSYIVAIQAENEDQALRYTEFYLGDCPDLSKPKDRREQKFKIKEIEMTINEAFELKEII
ncbi:MAG: hypothetical protein K8T10_11880 [Candidatus Eremiobacteraeota bacterium]|nr:hypothetical protein [Candidatus Eremiobacteraeota bacterium]